ncbi:hypothetical protein H5400_14720 [Rhodococcus wratislaviensis]|nr:MULTISPECIES: hypothetical protein [unclassified Rhodococcus (in: high G+C Gram-positive bacteria)]MBC2640125.1 hypothetical protein [Rhodococcus sp. 3A]MBC2895129.1 hypothetical protein [Rhodococcus sp. 4CII]
MAAGEAVVISTASTPGGSHGSRPRARSDGVSLGFSDTRPAARRYFSVDAANRYRIDDVRAAAVSYTDTGSA